MGFADTLKNLLAKAKAGGGSGAGNRNASTGGYGQSGQQQSQFNQSQGKFGQDDTRNAGGQSTGGQSSSMSGGMDEGIQPGGDKLNEPPQGRGGHVIDEGEDAIDRYGKDL